MTMKTGILRKPLWLNKKIDFKKLEELNIFFSKLKLNTICQEAKCPNMSECFDARVASFLILGNTCSRSCKFCAVGKGMPEALNPEEPIKVAEAVSKLELKHVVVTSVTRDDLPDGGAGVFCDTIDEIRKSSPTTVIEALVPDFEGREELIKLIIEKKPEVFAHNLETVPGLYESVRRDSDYTRSLKVLKVAKELNSDIYTKSGIMLGLGESETDVLSLFRDLREIKCDFLSIGQYLAPSLSHFKTHEFITPEKFEFYKEKAKELGFLHVESSPYVRSSYLASEYFNNEN